MTTKPTTPDETRPAMDAALLLLKYRGRSESELSKRLELKGFSPDIARKTVVRLIELGLVNDEKLAEDWVQSARQAGRGEVRIRQTLWKRGIPRDIIDRSLSAKPDDDSVKENEAERAWDAITRRAKRMPAGLDRQTLYRRLGGYLSRQGFSAECVHDVLEKYFSGARDDEDF